jgi:hypothetical protein
MLKQPPLLSNIVQRGISITRDLKMLVLGPLGNSFEDGSMDLLNPSGSPVVGTTAGAIGSNSFGRAYDFSASASMNYRFEHDMIDETLAMTIMIIGTTTASNNHVILNMNKNGTPFMVLQNGNSGDNVGLNTGNNGVNLTSGKRGDVANGADFVLIGTISTGSSKTIGTVFVNEVETTTPQTGSLIIGSPKDHVYWGSSVVPSFPFAGLSNMFAVWTRALTNNEMLSLSYDPWQLVREPYPISAIVTAASGTGAAAATGRRRIIVSA